MSELLVQAHGRPGPEAESEEQSIINIYYITGGDGPEVVTLNARLWMTHGSRFTCWPRQKVRDKDGRSVACEATVPVEPKS